MFPFLGSRHGGRKLYYNLDMPSFQRDFASLKTLDHGTGPAITFTRASGGTYFDSNGVLQTASNNVPRFDHDPATGASLGLLIEEARTNSIRNSQASGGAAGTPGTGMTNWNISGSVNGLTRTISLGTINGFSYIDVRFAGTSTATAQLFLDPEGLTAVTASSGQTWTHSAYVALIAGSVPDCQIGLREGLADGTLVVSSNLNAGPSLTSSLQRFSHTRTLTDATTARITPSIRVTTANGTTYDFTLRIAAPQLELGAFPTSYIPTTTAAATRSADSAVVTPISGFYNQAEGTLFAEGSASGAAGSLNALASADDTTAANRIQLRRFNTNSQANPSIIAASASQLSLDTATSTWAQGASVKLILGYKTDDCARSFNGGAVSTDTSATMPTGISRMEIGNGINSAYANGHIRKIAYYPKRLSNTLLQQLTT